MDLSSVTAGLMVCITAILIQDTRTQEPSDAFKRTTLNSVVPNGVKAQYEAISTAMLDTLRRAHFKEETASVSQRSRRDRVARSKQVSDNRGVYRLTSVEPLYPLCRQTRHVSLLNWNGDIFALCISASGFASFGRLGISGWTALSTWVERHAVQSAMFSFHDVLYAVVADSSRANGTELLRWSPEKKVMEIDHEIHSSFATAIVLWKMNVDEGNYHLAIANSKGPGYDISRDFTYTYDWRGTYFDQYDSVRSYDVRDLEAFHIYGQVYLAVGNHRVDNNNFNVDSEIFRFDLGDWRWKRFQRIRTRAVTDIRFFEMGLDRAKEFFLVFANQFEIVDGHRNYAIDSVIYKFVNGRFVPFQCLPTQGASSVNAVVDVKNGALLLTVANLFAPVQLYQYDGWKFVQTQIQTSGESMGPGVTALAFYDMHEGSSPSEHQVALVVCNPKKDTTVNVFALNFIRDSPLKDWYTGSLEWCSQAHDRINNTMIPELEDTMNKAQFIDQEELVISGQVSFQQSLTVSGTVLAHKVTNQATGEVLDYSLLFQLQEMYNGLQRVKERIERVRSALSRALRTSGTQTITGQFEFSSLFSSCETMGCRIEEVRTVLMNEVNVDDLANKILFLDEPNHVFGSLDFESLHVEGDIFVAGLVQGVNTSHIVTRTSNQRIIAEKTFEHAVSASNIVVQGLLDDIHISPETILLTEGDQFIQSEVTMTEIVVQDIEVDGTVNGINLHQFYEDVVLIDGGVQLVTGSKILKGDHTFENLHLETGKINGIDLVDLWNHVVWLDGEQTLHGPANFSVLSLVNPSTEHINTLQIPGPEIVSPESGPLHVSAHQRFLGDVVIDMLDIEESINGFGRITGKPTDCPNQLNILLRSCDQTLTGSNTFVSVLLGGKSQVLGKINDFDLTDLANHLLHKSQNLTGDWVFNQVELLAPVLVRGELSGWQAEDIYRRALKLGEPLPENALVVFTDLLQVERLVCPDLNGVQVEKDLLMRRGNGIVTGVKHWEHLLLLDNARVAGAINGLNINFLRDTLLNGPYQQVLQGHRVVNGDLVVNELDLGGFLSGLDLNRLIPLNSAVTLHQPLVLDNVRITGGLSAHNMAVLGGRVNGVNFGLALNDTMLYNKPQRVTGSKTILGPVIIPSDSEFNVASLNGISLSSLALDTVFKDVPQNIRGQKTFISPTHFENLIMNGSINGISVWEMFNDWMLQGVPQTISGDVVFRDGLRIDGDLNVRGLVNGIDVGTMKEDVINVREAFQITGDLNLNSAEVLGDITLTGKVQGIDLSEDAVLKFADNVIGGRKHFRTILVEGDLDVGLDLNGVNVEAMCLLTARRTGDIVLEQATVRGSVKIIGDLVTEGKINGLNIDDFKSSIYMVNESIDFREVIFKELVIQQDLVLHGSLNGADLVHLESNYMSLTKPQDVAAKFTFEAPVIYEGEVHVEELITGGGMIGDVNITNLARTVLTTVDQQVVVSKYIIQGNLYFKQDLEVSAPISGVNVPTDLALKTRDNVISGPLIFAHDLVVTSELSLSEGVTLQGVDVSRWAEETVMVTGEFTLTGEKTFLDIRVQDVVAISLFGSTNVSFSSILLSSGDQVMTGKVLFDNSLHVQGSLEAMANINGVNVPRLLEDSVLQNQPNVITGRKIFLAPLTVSRMTVSGFVAGVNVTELSILSNRPYDLEVIDDDLQRNTIALETVDDFIKNGPTKLSFYTEWFRWSQDSLEVLAWDYFHAEGPEEGLVVSRRLLGSPTCTRTTVYSFQAQGLVEKMDLPSSFAVSVKAFSFTGTTFLAVANVHSHCNPIAGGLQVFSLDSKTGDFVLMQQLSTESFTDVSPLKSGDSLPCLASVVLNEVSIYCLVEETQQFNLVQVLNVPGVLLVSFSSCHEGIFLASLAFQDGVWSVHLFSWKGELLVPLQKVPANQPLTAPLLFGHIDSSGAPFCLLVVAEGSLHDKEYVHPSSVYRYDSANGQFLKVQQLIVGGVVSVQWTRLGPSGDLLLTLLTSDTLHTLMWRGFAGFTPYDQVLFQGGKSLLSFTREDRESISHYVGISGRLCPAHWWGSEASASLILKARMRGT